MAIDAAQRSRTQSVVVDTSASPNVKLTPVPVAAVTIEDDFWAPRRRVNREATLPSQYRQLWETGRFANFLRVAGKHDGPFQGRYFNDSDVYKWMEAAAWSLAGEPDAELERQLDEAIEIVAGAQRADGYLDTYFELDCADKRWTNHDLHEMYCAGHLFQAAVAHHRVTGSTRLLDVAIRVADHIDATFGPPETGKRLGTDTHPEIELALVELFRVTGERRYLDLAGFLLDVRGHGLLGRPYGRFGPIYHQDHRPFREMDEIVGHAVRAVYLNAGAADIYAETGEPALGEALHRLWRSMTERKLYVSGGIGARYLGESFGEDYELPNSLSYAETCAAIGSAMWCWRMLAIEADARYADLIELQLYNAMLAGVSLDGQRYFYQNPHADEGHHRRSEWFYVACCPPNVARTLAALTGYVYSVSDNTVWVHFYVQGAGSLTLPGGELVRLRQTTRYPWDGEIAIEVQSPGSFTLRLRVPGWSDGGVLTVNGEPVDVALTPASYVELRRDWSAGDVVRFSLPMPVRRIVSHPNVEENAGRVALLRGPLLYCVEEADNPGLDLREIAISDAAEFDAEWRGDLLDGVVRLTGNAAAIQEDAWSGALHLPAEAAPQSTGSHPVQITAIPYYAWSNREPGRMRVWLRRDR